MKVYTGSTDMDDPRCVEVRMFDIEMDNGTRFRIMEEPLDHTIAVLRIGPGSLAMLPITITPVVSNKIIIA